ncbi:permease of the major facilitator superfamily [Renibacterium salmoninarum ATCC 33209]|uniref:Permease of the major facilitator superfamily n=1 Tax=Renibacterium salmoninarum (strain ATCC 33209 / DSM 20767 / JCM 11484 / NBRC 15589 / NCIMB 2235) TaxID=288705 RepID=A9WNK8_RENSM|nr:permease of the major facilitator superfamily [Renibacterium salmoninarum ATCC 33209]
MKMAQLFESKGASALAGTVSATDFISVPQSRFKRIFAFPNPVNEYTARFTAGLVVILALVTLATGWGWGLVILAAGFVLRVLFGPRISPFALLSVKVLAPRLGEAKLFAGPPKRFAQGMGAVISLAATVFFFAGIPVVAWAILVLFIVASSLESFLGFCLGCVIFGFLQRRGVNPESVCEACNNVSLRSVFSQQS